MKSTLFRKVRNVLYSGINFLKFLFNREFFKSLHKLFSRTMKINFRENPKQKLFVQTLIQVLC